MMDEINALAEEVAKAYLRHLNRETGSDIVTVNGVSKHVSLEQLAFGLAGVVHYNSKTLPDHEPLKDPHRHLQSMINVFTKPYTMTQYGLMVIDAMNAQSISSEEGRAM
ncbi:hypothetical protein WCT56_23220 [Pectobacterium parmentieri]|uniref:hypothetical protein n=1 Tax=Pectobacterium parmentieri TaxID=1905730 RepID=UPI000F8E0A53|nr:hypothetical protein [Pectobacterium parmentieri]AZS56805.1 hypothetical protein C5E18_12045 [Pectobacterium parmentieri]